MKGFIEIVMMNGDKSIESLRNIDRVYRYGDANNVKANHDKAVIVLNRMPHNHLISAETYDEIAEKIEAATEQPEPRQNRSVCINNGMSVEEATGILHDLQTKYVVGGNDSEVIDAIDVAFEAMGGYIPQNIYYRTEDRLPTAEDADASGEILVSSLLEYWFFVDRTDVKYFKFWAPCPKVEVRG